jgi:hypothetical protein
MATSELREHLLASIRARDERHQQAETEQRQLRERQRDFERCCDAFVEVGHQCLNDHSAEETRSWAGAFVAFGKRLAERYLDFELMEMQRKAAARGECAVRQLAIDLLCEACRARSQSDIEQALHKIIDIPAIERFVLLGLEDVVERLKYCKDVWTPRYVVKEDLYRAMRGFLSKTSIKQRLGDGRWQQVEGRYFSNDPVEHAELLTRSRQHFARAKKASKT